MKKFIKINEADNVVVALSDLEQDQKISLNSEEILIKDNIKRGHKMAINNIKDGEDIIKYGAPIGHATKDIGAGEWVHSHNTKTNLSGISEYNFDQALNSLNKEKGKYVFQGYRRRNKDVGIRNELWIVPTVGCVNGSAELIIKRFKEKNKAELIIKRFKEKNKIDGIDAIEVFKHNYGCSQLGDDHENTKKILSDVVKHPNGGGVLVLGLGCENNYVEEFKNTLGQYDDERVKFLVTQEVADEIEEGVKILTELYEKMKQDKREPVEILELKIGLKCGGSDGLSGITANPLVGAFSDFLISQGGSTILTEVPEMFGAETLLMNRSESEDVFNKTVSLINDFKEYFIEHKQPIYENPSPGNKEGGITTLEEKSLGCIQKGGKASIVGVLKYGEVLTKKGLNLLNAPGNDLVASTALAASGCQMVLFTTGRGTPFGSFVPTMKISSNTQLYKLKPHWIDFNAGTLVENEKMEEILHRFVEYILEVASGKLLNNEVNDFREIAIFKTGVTL
ncbi:UxaA family hydrolase [Alkalibacter saccharofermentans]|uniref:D-altronate dehydratase n=1 Tax=Alkalibacter saccharofermentans DSM 14828 TaxID=1120975 RepID=A0A1M4W4M0_9FIRM|nr:altronate dehydratase family protein [Alkalibacter saccharofermentans]SHE76244.1 D-altronate dehydratase [Alkalibacter saccharofermentans DSM 14828]